MRTADSIEETKAAKPESSKKAEKNKRGDLRGKHGNKNSLANLKPYVPGVSGNPSGKPGYDVAAALARAVIEGCQVDAYKGLADSLSKGNAYVFKELAERGYGKLKEQYEVKHVHEDVPDTDLAKRVSELLHDLGLAAQIDDAGRTEVVEGRASPTNGKAKAADVLS